MIRKFFDRFKSKVSKKVEFITCSACHQKYEAEGQEIIKDTKEIICTTCGKLIIAAKEMIQKKYKVHGQISLSDMPPRCIEIAEEELKEVTK